MEAVADLMYLDTFKGLRLGRDMIKTTTYPFYEVVPVKYSIPLGQINLTITFRDASNYPAVMLIFEVVDFSGPYHIILGRQCYIKFMATPRYTYLKLKISVPTGIITVEAKAQRVMDSEQDSVELAATTVAATKLKELCCNTQPSLSDQTMPSTSDTFKVVEDAKAV
jgi:hypothetical protein